MVKYTKKNEENPDATIQNTSTKYYITSYTVYLSHSRANDLVLWFLHD